MDKHKSIVLTRERTETCTVNLFGGNITSWKVNGSELIFCSTTTNYDNITPIRGGCCLSFPYYGISTLGPSHGFGRNIPWKVEHPPKKLLNGNIVLVLSCQDSPYTESIWCYKFHIEKTITLGKKCLILSYVITNMENSLPFTVNPLIHTYLKVDDIMKVRIQNLQGTYYFPSFNKFREYKKVLDEEEELVIRKSEDRLYTGCPDEILVSDVRPNVHLKITSKNMHDCIVWNPWTSKILSYTENDDYKYFIGIEKGRILNFKQLMPREKVDMVVRMDYVSPDDDEVASDNDYFKKYDLLDLCSKHYELSRLF